MRHLFKAMLPGSQPFMSRPAYAREWLTSFTFPVALGLIEGTVSGVLALKTFHVSPLAFAIIMGSSSFANITSFIWAKAGRGHPKVPFITGLMTAFLLLVTLVAFLPVHAAGGWMLVAIIVLSRCTLAGIITLRSTVWRNNYRKAVRARVTGRLALTASLVIAVVPMLGFAILDYHPMAFRVLYPAAALIGAIGAISFSRIRLRREKEILAFERQPKAKPVPHGTAGAAVKVYEYDPQASGPHASGGSFWSVLKNDHFFRKYMIFQFILGSGNISAMAVAVYVVADMTHHLKHGYFIAIFLTTATPFMLATLTLPAWSRFLDRVHITEFRRFHVWFFLADHLTTWSAILLNSLPLLFVSRLCQGLARGGAMMAWQLGHNDFAARNMVPVYMGIHATLTGVRGSIMPFIAIFLYTGIQDVTLFGLFPEGLSFAGIGAHVYLIFFVLTLIARQGFSRLARQLPVRPSASIS